MCHAGGHVPPSCTARRWDFIEKKNSGEQRQSRLRSWFSSKRWYRRKNEEQGSAAVIAFVLRERVDFVDTLNRTILFWIARLFALLYNEIA